MGVTAGANMWALLRDNDPGHDAAAIDDDRKHEEAPEVDGPEVVEEVADNFAPGGDAKPAKRDKKTKKKKDARDKKAKVAAPSTEQEEQMSGASRCRAVAVRICRTAVVGSLLALLWCHLTSAPLVAAGPVI
ncbi:unnamed protein product [Alopecurus aequalis]